MDARLAAYRAAAREGRDPTCCAETLALLIATAREMGAREILEIGAGEGLTSIALFSETGAKVTAIERDKERAATARARIAEFGADVRLLEGEAGELLPRLTGPYDLIFLDAAKVQYRRFYPEVKRLLPPGGVLFSDDVLLFRAGVPKKRKMLAQHLAEFLGTLTGDMDFSTKIYPYGDGVAVSKKRKNDHIPPHFAE